MKRIFAILTALAIVKTALAITNDVTSSQVMVKAWAREPLTIDAVTGEWSDPAFPNYIESVSASAVADRLPELYDVANSSVTTNLQTLLDWIALQRQRPVVMLTGAASLDNALDRHNLTMAIVSNEVRRTLGGVHIDAWVFSNAILASAPIMSAAIVTDLGRTTNWVSGIWTHGYEEGNGVDIEVDGETYETHQYSLDIPVSYTGELVCEVMRWCRIGDPVNGFDVGNRRVRINGKMTLHTNDVSYLYQDMSTSAGADVLTTFQPFVDNGLLKFTYRED